VELSTGEEDVVWLDVTVDDFVFVDVIDGGEELKHPIDDGFFAIEGWYVVFGVLSFAQFLLERNWIEGHHDENSSVLLKLGIPVWKF